MRRQVAGTIAIEKSRTVVDVDRAPRAPRKVQVKPRTHRVPLVMVEEEVSFVGRCEVREASTDRAGTFRILVRKGQVELGTPGDAWRMDGRFPAMDPGPLNGQREKDIGV